MRIVVTGATGNVGTSVVAAHADDPRVKEAPLDPAAGGPLRLRELTTGVGRRGF